MIIVAGTIPVQIEALDTAIQAMQAMAAETQQEAGCVTYNFYQDISNPSNILVYEIWESAETLAAHSAAPHMATFRAAIGPTLAGKPNVKRYNVEDAAEL